MATTTAHPIEGPAVWLGEDLGRTRDWIRPIPPAAVLELDAALRVVRARETA